METIRLILTILFGWTGLHKFLDEKPKQGLVYIFTFGLMGFGWIIDIVNAIQCIKKISSYTIFQTKRILSIIFALLLGVIAFGSIGTDRFNLFWFAIIIFSAYCLLKFNLSERYSMVNNYHSEEKYVDYKRVDNSVDGENMEKEKLYQEVKLLINEYEKIGYDVSNIKYELEKIKESLDEDGYVSYFDYVDLFRSLYVQHTYEKTSSFQGINTEKNIKTFKILYSGLSRHFVYKNYNSDKYIDDDFYSLYTSLIMNFVMSLGNRTSDEFYQLLINKEVLNLITTYLNQYNYQDICSVLTASISKGEYETSDLILSNVYNISIENNLDYFELIYEYLIDRLNHIKLDDTGKELLLKWAELSKIQERAIMLINHRTGKFTEEDKKNNSIDEINVLLSDIIENKDRLYKCIFSLNRVDHETANQISRNIFDSNYDKAVVSFDIADALFRIICINPLIDSYEDIERTFEIINSYRGVSDIPQYKKNAAFGFYIRYMYYECLKNKKISLLDLIEEKIYMLDDSITDDTLYGDVDGITISMSMGNDELSLRSYVMSNIIWGLSNVANDKFASDRVNQLVEKINSKGITKIYNENMEREKIRNEEYDISKVFVDSVTDKSKLELISIAYYKMLSNLRKKELQFADLKTIFDVVANNTNLYEELPTGNSINLGIMFFEVMESANDNDIIMKLLDDKKINFNIKEKIKTYSMYDDKNSYYKNSDVICDKRCYDSIAKALFCGNTNERFIEQLKSIINSIESKKTKKKINELFDLYASTEISSLDELEKINNSILKKILSNELSNIYLEFIAKASKNNYKTAAFLLLKYIKEKEQRASYDENNIINIGNIINNLAIENGTKYFMELLNFDVSLKQYYLKNCIDMHHIVELRKHILVENFVEILTFIINNIDDKNNFILKCLSSLNYRKIITPYEILFFETEIGKIEKNDKLLRKLELLKEKVSE